MTEILNICDTARVVEGGLAPIASLPPPLCASHLLGLGVSDEAAVASARTWLGTPFRHQGRKKGVGCDCLGLLIGVAEELGLCDSEGRLLALHDDRRYGHYPDSNYLKSGLARVLTVIEQPIPGSIGLFRIDGIAQHLGIFGWQDSGFRIRDSDAIHPQKVSCFRAPSRESKKGGMAIDAISSEPQIPNPESTYLTLIHAYAPARKVVEHRFSEEWQKKLVRSYGLPI